MIIYESVHNQRPHGRWKNDHNCEWRTDKWLEVSLASLPYFASMKDAIDTGELSVEQVADMIIAL